LVENKHTGGCIFVDHASGYIFINFQVLQNSTETIEGKMKFERHLFNNGIVVRNYHTDNGIFNSKDFINELIIIHNKLNFQDLVPIIKMGWLKEPLEQFSTFQEP
jgi:hypothetical protein